MLTLLDYDASRCLFHKLLPRMHYIVSGGSQPLALKLSRLKDPDLHPRQHFTLTSARSSSQGHHQLVRMTSVPDGASGWWWARLKSSLGLLRRNASGQSSKLPPSDQAGKRPAPSPPPPTLPLKDSPASLEAFKNARKFQEIPGPTTFLQAVPFAGARLLYYPFGNETSEDMGGMLSKLQASYGPIMRVRLGPRWVVFIENLGDIQHAVSIQEKELSHPGPSVPHSLPSVRISNPLDRLKQPVKDPALLWLDAGVRPQKMRKAVNKHVGAASTLTQYLPVQDDMAKDLLRQLERCLHSPQEIQTLLHRYALESSGQLCFNQKLGLLGDHYLSDGQRQRLVESYRTVTTCLGEILTGTRLFYNLFQDPFAKRFQEAKNYVQAWERRQMRQVTMAALRDKGAKSLQSEECSLLISLLDNKELTEEDISDILYALMATRSEASSSALLMLLASLATNVDAQEKLSKDILQKVGPEGSLKAETLQDLPFLGACIEESLRLYFPMSSGGQIVLSNNIVLSNYLIPAGVPIEVNSRRTAKNPTWFDHPGFYMPERWLGQRAEKIPALAFMPFGFMDYRCLGLRSFFFQEVSAAVIKILQKYRIDLPEEFHNNQIQTVHTPFRVPKEPLPFIFTPRKQ